MLLPCGTDGHERLVGEARVAAHFGRGGALLALPALSLLPRFHTLWAFACGGRIRWMALATLLHPWRRWRLERWGYDRGGAEGRRGDTPMGHQASDDALLHPLLPPVLLARFEGELRVAVDGRCPTR